MEFRQEAGNRRQCESVFVDIARFPKQIIDEIAGADVVRELAEEFIAEGIEAHVLHDAAAVGIRVGFAELGVRGTGKTRQQ